MECNRGTPPCLDWREICDGKIDCLDSGSDELACDELDANECATDEFLCNSGLCIPYDLTLTLKIGLGNNRCITETYGAILKLTYLMSFQTFCNGFVEHDRLDSLNYTDEMDCEH